MRALNRKAFIGLVAALLAGCGSTPTTKANEELVTGGPVDKPGETNPDDDFIKKTIVEVKEPVYLDGIDHAAQDAFRLGVQAVSQAKPALKVAEAKFKEAAEKAPDFLEAYFNWGQALERQGRNDEALGVYQKAVDQNPGDSSASAYIAKIYLGKARTAKFMGQAAEAEQWLSKSKVILEPLIAKEPNNVAANNSMALYYLMKGDVDTAERFVKEVLFVDPSNVTGLNTRGLINLKRGKLLLAKWIFENKVLREDPSSTEAHTNLGYTYITLDQRPMAMKQFEAALESDAENMEVRMNIAAMLLEHLDYAQAVGHYDKVLVQQPNNAEAKIGRCDALYGLGGTAADKPAQFETAIACYDAYVKEHPQRADLLKRIAETYQNKLQNLEKAVAAFEVYLKLGKLDAKESDKIQKTIASLKDIIAKGGLKAMLPEEPPPEDAPKLISPPEGGTAAPTPTTEAPKPNPTPTNP